VTIKTPEEQIAFANELVRLTNEMGKVHEKTKTAVSKEAQLACVLEMKSVIAALDKHRVDYLA
jgi:hypothetical protein